jgi:hypothetical protein
MPQIANNASQNTTTNSVALSGSATLYCYGVFNGARVFIDISSDNTNFMPFKTINDLREKPVFLRNNCSILDVVGAYYIRARIVGGNSSTSITIDAIQ